MPTNVPTRSPLARNLGRRARPAIGRWAVLALLAAGGVLLVADPAQAQRRGGTQRSSVQRSAPQRSAPQRSSPVRSAPQRSVPQRSVPQRSVPQRSTPQRSVPQRSTPQRSVPQRSTPQRSVPQRSTPQRSVPTYSAPTRSVTPAPGVPTRSVTPSRSVPTRYDSAGRATTTPTRSTTSAPPTSAPPTLSAPSRGWTPAPSRTTPTRGSENVIDFGEAFVRPRTQLPVRAGSRPEDGRAGAGRGVSLPVRTRAQVSEAEAASAQRALAARADTSIRSRTVTRSEILDRYRGAERGAPAPSERGVANADSTAARITTARRDAAARAAESRILAARQELSSSAPGDRSTTRPVGPVGSVRGEKSPASSDALAGRIASARADALADRVQSGRADYLAALGAQGAVRPSRGAVAGGSGAITAGPGVAPGTVTSGSHGHYGHTGYFGGWHGYYNSCYWNSYGGYFGYGCSSWWWWGPSYACGYWWNSYWYGGGYWYPSYRPHCYWYGPFLPWSVSIVLHDEPEVIYVEQEPQVIVIDDGVDAVGETVVAAPAAPAAPSDELNRAANYYLTLGDDAFLEGRYGDAVHYYAKAVEFSPEDGILYLVLSDALFATGDYRYAAFAVRQAFERDPALASHIVDKRGFYADPTDFDRQLATLERYLEDHFLDDDARLVLAANYLFGGRPREAQELLESPFSESLRGTPAGGLLLEASAALSRPPAALPPAAEAPAEAQETTSIPR